MPLNFFRNTYRKLSTPKSAATAQNLSPEAITRIQQKTGGATPGEFNVYGPQRKTPIPPGGIVPPPVPKITPPKPEGTFPPPETKFGTTDFEKYYAGISGSEELKKQQAELEAQRAADVKARETGLAEKKTLLTSSEDLYNKLFGGEEITSAKKGRDEARSELASIDREEIDATNAVKGKAIPGWAAAGQMRIIQDAYAGRRSSAAAKYEIENGNYTEARQHAEEAYNHSLNVLKLKTDFIDETLKNSKDLTEEERVRYNDLLGQAKDYYNIQKDSANEHNDLFIKLASAGVSGLSPTMTTDELRKIAGTQLPAIAKRKEGTSGERRDTSVGNYLESKRGTDGLVAATTYLDALRQFVAAGGSRTNFLASFPQQLYLRSQEIAKLPVELRPKAEATSFSAAIEEAVGMIEQYKAAGYSKKDIEKLYGDKAVPLEVRSALDQIYK